jgi:hypothetical protein
MTGKSLSKNHFPAKRPSFLRNTICRCMFAKVMYHGGLDVVGLQVLFRGTIKESLSIRIILQSNTPINQFLENGLVEFTLRSLFLVCLIHHHQAK